MERLALMLLTLTVSTFFLIVPDSGPDRYQPYTCPHGETFLVDTWAFPEDPERIDFFLFDDKTLYLDTWVWIMGGHLINLLMAVVIYRLEKVFTKCSTIYLAIHVVDLMFFVISYGDPFKGIKLTWNIMKIFIFGYAIGKETGKY
jgi:hypothetical protein